MFVNVIWNTHNAYLNGVLFENIKVYEQVCVICPCLSNKKEGSTKVYFQNTEHYNVKENNYVNEH